MNPHFLSLSGALLRLFVRNLNFWDRKSTIFYQIGEKCHECLQAFGGEQLVAHKYVCGLSES
jgi:hypothetical protein